MKKTWTCLGLCGVATFAWAPVAQAQAMAVFDVGSSLGWVAALVIGGFGWRVFKGNRNVKGDSWLTDLNACKQLVEGLGEPTLIHDQTRILACHPHLADSFGWRDLAGRSLSDLGLKSTEDLPGGRLDCSGLKLFRRSLIEGQCWLITLAEQPQSAAHQADLFERVFENSHLLVAYLDRDFNFVRVNSRYAEADKNRPEDLAGRNHFDLYPNAENQAIFEQVRDSGQPHFSFAKAFQYRSAPERGVSYWDWSLTPVWDRDHLEVTGLVLILQDVSERIQTQEELDRVEAGLRAARKVARIGAWMVDYTTEELQLSSEAFEILGIDPWEKPTLERFYQAVLPEDRAQFGPLVEQLKLGAPVEIEYRVLVKGKIRWIKSVAEAAPDEKGEVHSAWGAVYDFTDQKKVQEGLVAEKEAAEQANQAKTNFLAMVSHELRTPLNGILGASELLDSAQLNLEERGTLQLIKSSGWALVRLLEDILDLSRIEAGLLELRLEPFDLHRLVDEQLKLFSAATASRPIKLHAQLEPGMPQRVIGDRLRLSEVLSNLMGNAVKFTDHGSVSLKVSGEKAAEQTWRLRFEVEDTGVGIDETLQERLFEPFTQADETSSRPYGGLGLGLSVVSRLVRLMGGKAGFKSTLGKGSLFWVELEMKEAAESLPVRQVSADEKPPELGLKVLLVEDDAINRQVILRQLKLFGCQVEALENGAKVVERMGQQRFDLILMDLLMPVMNGFEATKLIRQHERLQGQDPVPIIALSARMLEDTEIRCEEVGMNGFLPKPLPLDQLEAALARVSAEASRAKP